MLSAKELKKLLREQAFMCALQQCVGEISWNNEAQRAEFLTKLGVSQHMLNHGVSKLLCLVHILFLRDADQENHDALRQNGEHTCRCCSKYWAGPWDHAVGTWYQQTASSASLWGKYSSQYCPSPGSWTYPDIVIEREKRRSSRSSPSRPKRKRAKPGRKCAGTRQEPA